MKPTPLLLCMLCVSFACFSQDKNFDLSKYKFPDYKRHELEFNLSSNGGTDNSQYLWNDKTEKSLSSKNHSDARIGYTFRSLSRKKVDYLYSSLSGIYDFSKNKSYGSTYATKNIDLSSQLNFYWDRQVYWKEDKWFLDIINQVQYNFRQNKEIVPKRDNQPSTYHNINASVGLGVGVGRLESVNDLVQSCYILEKLKTQKALAHELEEKDIFEFAKFASKLKNKRFFDTRLRRIAELQALDSLLHNSGLIENKEISYFTTLNDLWSYGYFGNRYSGTVLKFWFGPEYLIEFSKANTAKSNTISSSTYGASNLSFVSNKQLNLFWDCNFYIGVRNRTFITQAIDTDDSYYERQGNLFNANAGFGFGFYPDSRTSINFTTGYYGYDETNNKSVYDYNGQGGLVEDKYWANTLNSRIGGTYFISPQLQLTGSFRLSYNDKGYQSTDNFYTQYNLGLRYAIF
jgi:hypothetical protein